MPDPTPEPATSAPTASETARAEISLLNPHRFPEPAVRRLRPWVEDLVRELAAEADSFTVRFTGDPEIHRLNREYRGKDTATDVLSFPGETTVEGRHLGDLVISVPAARRQAREAGHSTEREIRCLVLHGLLHCMGYDHETDDGAMERLERRLARRWIDGRRPEERRRHGARTGKPRMAER